MEKWDRSIQIRILNWLHVLLTFVESKEANPINFIISISSSVLPSKSSSTKVSDKILNSVSFYTYKKRGGASLVAQWLRVCLPVQGTQVRALVWEDPTCRRAAGPVSHSYWACASGACGPQQVKPRPAHCDEEWPPLATTRESPHTEMRTQHSHK